MIKRVSSILLLATYAIFSVGIAISSHDCMGVTSDTSFFSYHNDGCACESNKDTESHDCCSDDLEVVTLEDDQSFVSASVNISSNYFLLFAFDTVKEANNFKYNNFKGFMYNTDTPPIITPLYKLNCTYLVYG